MTADPGATVLSVDGPGTYTVAVTYCLCGVPVGECDCGEMVADWLHRFEDMHRQGIRQVIP